MIAKVYRLVGYDDSGVHTYITFSTAHTSTVLYTSGRLAERLKKNNESSLNVIIVVKIFL